MIRGSSNLCSFSVRFVAALAIVVFFALMSRAGGPEYVTGSSYFTTMGQPMIWSQGVVNYYTDQGDLSPILPNATANSFVAGAFGVWTLSLIHISETTRP